MNLIIVVLLSFALPLAGGFRAFLEREHGSGTLCAEGFFDVPTNPAGSLIVYEQ